MRMSADWLTITYGQAFVVSKVKNRPVQWNVVLCAWLAYRQRGGVDLTLVCHPARPFGIVPFPAWQRPHPPPRGARQMFRFASWPASPLLHWRCRPRSFGGCMRTVICGDSAMPGLSQRRAAHG